MEKISIGFLFSDKGDKVALMRRSYLSVDGVLIPSEAKSNQETSLLTGIGGHIEFGETRHQAMQREFKEEAILDLPGWEIFAEIYEKEKEISFFRLFSDSIYQIKTGEDDVVSIYPTSLLKYHRLYPNLEFLIPLALERNLKSVTLIY